MSLLHPPPRFPAHLVVIWPLIWVQVLALRAAMRAAYGRGVQYHWSVTPWGRVFLASIDWIPGQAEAPAWLKPAAHSNDRLAAALDGRLFTPAYACDPLIAAHPGASRDPDTAATALAALGPGLRRDERKRVTDLPVPET